MKLGISSYTYPWAVGVADEVPAHRLDALALLDRAQALDVSVLQLADGLDLHKLSVRERTAIVQRADAMGIALEVGTRATDRQHLLDYLDVAVQMRSPFLRVVMQTATRRLTADEHAALIRSVLPEFARANIVLAIETHESLRASQLRSVLQQTESEWVGVCFDTANSLGCFEPAESVLAELKPYIVNLHVKDVAVRRVGYSLGFLIEGTPVGGGALDIVGLLAVIQALPRPGINAIIEHWVPPAENLSATLRKEESWAAQSVAFLRPLLTV